MLGIDSPVGIGHSRQGAVIVLRPVMLAPIDDLLGLLDSLTGSSRNSKQFVEYEGLVRIEAALNKADEAYRGLHRLGKFPDCGHVLLAHSRILIFDIPALLYVHLGIHERGGILPDECHVERIKVDLLSDINANDPLDAIWLSILIDDDGLHCFQVAEVICALDIGSTIRLLQVVPEAPIQQHANHDLETGKNMVGRGNQSLHPIKVERS